MDGEKKKMRIQIWTEEQADALRARRRNRLTLCAPTEIFQMVPSPQPQFGMVLLSVRPTPQPSQTPTSFPDA